MKTFALIDATRAGKIGEDWLTPPHLVRLLGPFDLDPCASVGQPWRTARRMIAPPRDGLREPWRGLVFCNPPYGRALRPWTARVAEHGHGILLVPAATEMKWFRPIWLKARALFFVWERLMFYYPASAGKLAGTLCLNRWRPHVLAGFGRVAAGRLRRLSLAGSFVEGWDNRVAGIDIYEEDP